MSIDDTCPTLSSYHDLTDQIYDTYILVPFLSGKSIRSCCRSLNIDTRQLLNWIDQSPERQQQFAQAKKVRAELMADEIVEDIDCCDPSNYAAMRARFDMRRWLMGKYSPAWSDKTQLEVSGVQAQPVVHVTIPHVTVEMLETGTVKLDQNDQEPES